MNRLLIKGGYGEHGRSCFLVPCSSERYYMLDCGIMDTDPNPYPQVEPEYLARTDYLFLSHCHKDHSGGFDEMVRKGFAGWLVASRPTLEFSGIRWEKTLVLDSPEEPSSQAVRLDGGLSFSYGKTGHCAGSVWFRIQDSEKSVLYTGDYQKRALAYETDPIEGMQADLAIIDCAHEKEQENADVLRTRMTGQIGRWLAEETKILMPLPKYGRGPEVICMLRQRFPHAAIAADSNMVGLLKKTLAYSSWLKPEAVCEMQAFLDEHPEKRLASGDYEILLLADPHLERPESIRLAREMTGQGAAALLTGRVKKGCLTETLLAEQKAVSMVYPHHQSRGDFLEMAGQNQFSRMLPFHNPEKELYW